MELIPQVDDIGQRLFDWYDEKWNLRTPFSKKAPLTLDTSLSTGKYPWVWEDGFEIMEEYFERFQVDKSEFDFMKYWPEEVGITSALFSLLLPKSKRKKTQEPEPLTINMLIESAKAGRWLY